MISYWFHIMVVSALHVAIVMKAWRTLMSSIQAPIIAIQLSIDRSLVNGSFCDQEP